MKMNPQVCEQNPTLDVVLTTVLPALEGSTVRKARKLAKLLVLTHDLIAHEVATKGAAPVGGPFQSGAVPHNTIFSGETLRPFGCALERPKFLPSGGEAAQEFSFVLRYTGTGITRRRKFPNSGTVNAVSPCAGL
jgi:hypothetical protein